MKKRLPTLTRRTSDGRRRRSKQVQKILDLLLSELNKVVGAKDNIMHISHEFTPKYFSSQGIHLPGLTSDEENLPFTVFFAIQSSIIADSSSPLYSVSKSFAQF